MSSHVISRGGLALAGRRAAVGAMLLAAAAWMVSNLARTRHLLYDFKGGLYNAGTAILSGHDPYHAGFIAHQAAIMRAGGTAIGETTAHAFSLPVYPAPANLAIIPLSVLPYWVAGLIFTLLSVAAMVLALRLLEVRDWRCYALTAVSWPFVYSLELGALGPMLVLGVAVIWRWREELWPPAIALAAIVVTKVFPFPLGVWMLITRRYRALALAVVLGAVLTLAAWGVLGFAGLAAYPKMLSNISLIQEGRSDSLAAVLLALGVSSGAAQVMSFLVAGGMLGLAWWVSRAPDGQRPAYGLAVIAALIASPIVWDHYLVLLFVPIALLSPGYSRVWLLPIAGTCLLMLSLLIAPLAPGAATHTNDESLRTAVIALALEAVLVFRLCRSVALLPLRTFARRATARAVVGSTAQT